MKVTWDELPAVRRLCETLSKCFVPPLRIKCSDWVLKFRILPATSAKGGGRFNFNNHPWQAEVLDAPDEPDVNGVVLMWASQVTGKTETINNRTCYTIHVAPRSILMVQPTLEMGEDWSKNRFMPAVTDTPCLRGVISETRSSQNKILYKKYPGGFLAIAGANSPASLAGRPIRDTYFDETDRYPASAGTEGDPIALGETRTESYPDSTSFKTSTPGIEGLSRIKKEFDKSDRRYWFVKCPHCQHEQHLQWKNVRWTWTNPDGTEDAAPRRACIVCDNETCRKEWTEAERQAAIRAGKWKATAPFNGIRGYHLNAIYALIPPKKGYASRLHMLVDAFLKAQADGKEGLMTFVNTRLAETWTEAAEKPMEWEVLFQRREPYTVPAGCFLLIAKVDVQGDRFEVEVEGFGFGEESWGIEYRKIFGNPHRSETWKALDEYLAKKWEHPSGQKIGISITGIDMGGQKDKKSFAVPVYRYVRSRMQASRGRGGVIALKGSSTRGAPLVTERLQKNGVNLLMVGTDTAKSTVYDRLKIEEPGPRYCHFPESYTEEYFRGLTSEEMRVVKRKGYLIKEWHKTRERNEPLDLKAYGVALFELLNPDMRAIATRYKMPKAEPKTYTLEPAKQFEPKPAEVTAQMQTQPQQPRPQQIHRPRRRLPFRRGF